MPILALLLALPGLPDRLLAQAGALETGFDAGLNSGALIYVVKVQPDGQILIGGAFYSVGGFPAANVARLNPDGSVDKTFSPGLAADLGYIDAIAVQPDGKVLIGGAFSSVTYAAPANLARLNSDGSVDTSFDPSLVIDAPVNGIVLQSDGKIVFGGSFNVVDNTLRVNIARLYQDGTLDLSFDACVASSAGAGATGLAVQTNDQILASGDFTFSTGASRSGIARLKSCGELDPTYASSQPGLLPNSTAYTLALRGNGQVLLGGDFRGYYISSAPGIVQLTDSGDVDDTFDPGTGIDFQKTVYAIALQKDGKAIIAGNFTTYNGQTKYGLARLNLDGSLDPTFDPGLGPNNSVSSLAVQKDGKTLVAGKFTSFNGASRTGFARLKADPLPFRLGAPSPLGNGQMQLMFYGENQAHYALQTSPNLTDWTSITNFTVTSPSMVLVDSTITSLSNRFYRALILP